MPPITSADLVGVERGKLDYEGWWNAPHVEPITRHVPLNLDRSTFLDRSVALAKVVVEALAQRHLRRIVTTIGEQPDKMDGFGALKLLDRIVCLAQVANESGLLLWKAGDELTRRLASDGTDRGRPLDRLFALNDLRQAGAHRKGEIVESALARFGVDITTTAAGWGTALDAVYDGLIEELESINATLGETLSN